MSASDKWKCFERLVTAIHQAADEGAEVGWNEKINGRQFDVTIRFKKGLYEYLTVVECKDYTQPVPVEKVEAFVTKTADVKADRAVMASTSGFQQGAQDVAARHGMTLIHVTESSDVDPSQFRAEWAGVTDVLHFKTVELEYADGERKRLSEQANEMAYYMKQVLMDHGDSPVNLETLFRLNEGLFLGEVLDVYKEATIRCPPGTRVVGPDDGVIPLKPLASIHVYAGITKAKQLRGPVVFDPYLLVPTLNVKNLGTGTETIFGQHTLAVGVDTRFEPGKFYESYSLSSFYYCDSIDGKTATLYLVESFQLGSLVQAIMRMPVENGKFYVPVTDKDVIQRLARRLEELKKLSIK